MYWLTPLTMLCLAVAASPARADLLVHYDFSNVGTPVSGANFEVINGGSLGASHHGDGFGSTSIVSDDRFGAVVQYGNDNGSFIRLGDSGAGIPGGKLTTIAAWYKGNNFQHMFDQRDTPGPRLVITGNQGGNVLRAYDGTFEDSGFAVSNLYDNQWHHWAVTIDGNSGTGQFYVDGAPVGKALQNLTAWNMVTGDTTIWGASTSSPFSIVSSGLHHDIRIYNELLGGGEIAGIAEREGLFVDFNDNDDSGNGVVSRTRLGYHSVTQNGASGLETTIGTIDVSLSTLGGNPDRDRGALTGSTGLSDLARDFIFASASAGTLDITLAGLDAGLYEFTGYFHDNDVDQGTVDVSYSADGGTTFLEGEFGVQYSTDTAPASLGMATFMLTTSGSDDLVIRLEGSGLHLINGFDLVPVAAVVPEPSAGILLALGGLLGWTVMYRKRNR